MTTKKQKLQVEQEELQVELTEELTEEYKACKKAVSFKDTLMNSFMSGMQGTITVRDMYDRSPNPTSVTISTKTLMDPATEGYLNLKEDWEKENYKKLVHEAIRIITQFNMKRVEVLTIAKSLHMLDKVLKDMEDNDFLLIDAPTYFNNNRFETYGYSIKSLKDEEEVREHLHKSYKHGEVIVYTRSFPKCITFEEFEKKYPMLKREHYEALQLEQVVVKLGGEYKICESTSQADKEFNQAFTSGLSLAQCDKWTISQLLKNRLVLATFLGFRSGVSPEIFIKGQVGKESFSGPFVVDTGCDTSQLYVPKETYDKFIQVETKAYGISGEQYLAKKYLLVYT
jgi:hypothetical protein